MPMRIAIVNDMPLAVEALRRVLRMAPDLELAWVATDGKAALRACIDDTPDLVLMDVMMPGMDGVEATRRIMAEAPCPILLVTVSIDANVRMVFEAMGHGALDAVDLPHLNAADPAIGAQPLLRKIAALRRLIGDHARPAPPTTSYRDLPLIAIGASAGGPVAVAALLHGLPQRLPAAVVVVQHVDAQFIPGLVSWLQQNSALPVRAAQDDEALKPGVVLLAGRSEHLVLKPSGRLGYTEEPSNHVYRPSVDVLFNSIAREWRGDACGVLLTGMGRDGAAGLLAMRRRGWPTIAQDRQSSAIYGMPKAAVELGAASESLALDDIAPRLVRLCARAVERAG